MLGISDLHDYQNKAIDFLYVGGGRALFLDCGLGKTVCTLTALVRLKEAFCANRILIVAPKKVCEDVWRQEAAKWSHCKHLTFSTMLGSPKQREQAYHGSADIHLINFENLAWLINEVGFNFDTVVFDEFSKMKSHDGVRFEAFKHLRHKVHNVFGLTATPIANGYLGLWAQLYCLDMGRRLSHSYSQYRDRYFEANYTQTSYDLIEGCDLKIKNKVKDICLSMEAEDYIKMPPLINVYVDVFLPKKARAMYDELEAEYLLCFDEEINDDEDNVVIAETAAVLSNKLLQFCDGSMYVGDSKEYVTVHNAKMKALEELVDSHLGKPLLVAYNFKKDRDLIIKRFKYAKTIDSPNVVKKWNKGEVKMLLVHPASAGHGLNIQQGGNTIIWYGNNWSYELYYQLYKRLHRQGQKKPVTQYHLVVKDSRDETVIQSQNNKKFTQDDFLHSLKSDIEKRQGG